MILYKYLQLQIFNNVSKPELNSTIKQLQLTCALALSKRRLLKHDAQISREMVLYNN